MAKYPTAVEGSVSVKAPLARAYGFMLDVLGRFRCVPGLASCTRVGADRYRFVFEEVSRGPIRFVTCYTARYLGNGSDSITFASVTEPDDNTDVTGTIRLRPTRAGATTIALRQRVAPDLPVPRLFQAMARPLLEREAAAVMEQELANIKQALETA
jgi:carbon monoxide dehydrogenase subunit G